MIDVEGHEAAEDCELFAAERQWSFMKVRRQNELQIECVKVHLGLGLEHAAGHRCFDGAWRPFHHVLDHFVLVVDS